MLLMPFSSAASAAAPGLLNPQSISSAPSSPTSPLSTAERKPGVAQALSVDNSAKSISAEQNLGSLPLSFELNGGQVDSSIRFLAHSSTGTFFFAPDHLLINVSVPATDSANDQQSGKYQDPGKAGAPDPQNPRQPAVKSAQLRMDFVGADTQTSVQGGTLLPGKVNYYIGNDPSKWHTNLPTYADIAYSSLYSGIDLNYSGAGGGVLKGTYTVAPGANPSLIRWRYENADNVSVDVKGNLRVRLSVPMQQPQADPSSSAPTLPAVQPITVTEQTPVAWQQIDGQQVPVEVRYAVGLAGGNSASIGFELGSYDRSQPLIIDPSLSYSTYIGGDAEDDTYGIAVDSQGNV
jgi:hypothetical protein